MSRRYTGVLPLDHKLKERSAPADALTALDNALKRAITRGAAKGSPSYKELREVRAAFAELIEAGDALVMTPHGHVDSVLQARIAAISAALDRAKGGAA